MMTLDDLRAQAMDELTPEQLREASDAALLLCGWTKHERIERVLPRYKSQSGNIDLTYWKDPSGEWQSKRPNPAADLTDAAALMPEGHVTEVFAYADGTTNVRAWPENSLPSHPKPHVARREPYARMLAAVVAHLEKE